MITTKPQILEELNKNIGKLCLFDIYKENQFDWSTAGKLTKGNGFFEIRDFCIYPDAVQNVEYFGSILRIQIRP